MKTKPVQETAASPRMLIRIKRAGQITLPLEIRKRFNLAEGDYLEVKVAANGILLQPVAVVARQRQRGAARKAKNKS